MDMIREAPGVYERLVPVERKEGRGGGQQTGEWGGMQLRHGLTESDVNSALSASTEELCSPE
jgi:hypothetical protein